MYILFVDRHANQLEHYFTCLKEQFATYGQNFLFKTFKKMNKYYQPSVKKQQFWCQTCLCLLKLACPPASPGLSCLVIPLFVTRHYSLIAHFSWEKILLLSLISKQNNLTKYRKRQHFYIIKEANTTVDHLRSSFSLLNLNKVRPRA